MLDDKIDPISLEVIRNGLSSAADEMALVIMRSAYSPVVRDTMDFSTSICDKNGEVIAQGLTLAVQLGAFPDIMKYIIEEKNISPGDVFLANDPYGSGGQHLPDIYVIKPIFYNNKLHGYAATMAHHCDVGGLTPGSVAMHATEVFQEGLRLPILKLYEQGRENQTLVKIIKSNTRQPVQVLGDLRAQISACKIGEKSFSKLIEKYGAEKLHLYFDKLHKLAEMQMRNEISAIPNGKYTYTDYIDGFGKSPIPLEVSVTVIIQDDEIIIDFSGTSEQVEAGINCPIAMARSASYCAIRCISEKDIPNCQGYMRPITITAPSGSLLNPILPAACGARGVMGYRVFDSIMGALSKIVPKKVIAGCEGGPSLFSIGGYHNGKPFVLTEVLVGTWGARAELDGVEGISNPAANLSNQPIELLETELPLEIVRYGLVPDSGGAGKQRGGLAFVREFRVRTEKALLTVRSDRRDHPPYGFSSGKNGAPSMNYLDKGLGEEILPTMPMEAIELKKGYTFRHHSAGGGGIGEAMKRDENLVLEDVLDEKVTPRAAEDEYGVIIDPQTLVINRQATLERRDENLRKSKSHKKIR